MIINRNHIKVEVDKAICRISDVWVAGQEIYLG